MINETIAALRNDIAANYSRVNGESMSMLVYGAYMLAIAFIGQWSHGATVRGISPTS